VLVHHFASSAVSSFDFFFCPFFAIRIDIAGFGLLLCTSSRSYLLIKVFVFFQ
jgi:hypothetical protein